MKSSTFPRFPPSLSSPRSFEAKRKKADYPAADASLFSRLKQLFKNRTSTALSKAKEGRKAAIILSSAFLSRELRHRGDNGREFRNAGRPLRIKLLAPSRFFIVPVQSRLIAVESTNGIAFEAGIVKRKEGKLVERAFSLS